METVKDYFYFVNLYSGVLADKNATIYPMFDRAIGMRSSRFAVSLWFLYLVSATAIGGPNIDHNRAVNAENEPHNWLLHGRTYNEQRFSPLKQINDDSIGKLGLDWFFETNLTRGHEASPIVVDGVMYLTTPWSRVIALDARNGTMRWQYDPGVPGKKAYDACCDVVNRGVAVWKERVYVGTIDGRLIALDAKTGAVVWDVVTIDPAKPYTITGAPRVIQDKVLIGNGGAELGVRGYLTAYDAATGKRLWRFYSVPGDPAKPFESEALKQAVSTWKGGQWWKIGGGGTMWDSMAYDPDAHLVYVGTGNGSPWNRWIRSPGGGDNLYLSSIVALDPDTGNMRWYFQTTPGDTWDFTATQHMILADIVIDKVPRKVIMQAPKNGFFYVLDRITGEFISGAAYIPVTWADGLDDQGRPIENASRLYRDAPRRVTPTPVGAHNWEPMTFSPDTGLAYIPTKVLSSVYAQDEDFVYSPEQKDAWGVDLGVDERTPEEEQTGEPPGFYITAWNPVLQSSSWRAEVPGPPGGLLSTAGNLVLGGHAEGDFNAYAADTGNLLWSYFTERGILAPPISYAIDGKQFIAILTGWGGASGLGRGSTNPQVRNRESARLLVFSLDGGTPLPEQFEIEMEPPELPAVTASAETVAEGKRLFADYCSRCHAFSKGGAISNLIDMPGASHAGFQQIVRDGLWESVGMIGFGKMLTDQQIEAIHQYIIAAANESAR